MPPSPTDSVIIAGPTAVGKSDLAVAVAERCGGEIVGADAFQIYRDLDLLTAKPSPELRARIPHHLVGEIPLTQSFDVSQYLALARESIAAIRARQKIPIVVGGTGMYLRALMRGLADLPGADATIRAELETRPLADLQRQFAELDPDGVKHIDLENPRRVIRALEVCLLTGRPFSSFREQWSAETSALGGVVLTLDRELLHARIERRTAAMFDAGVLDEVASCDELGPTAGQVLGLREIQAHLRGEISRAQCIAAIAQATRQYAKRQMTWFRREPALEMIDISSVAAEELADRLATQATAMIKTP
ncbi:tRNA delta(2)-isopentenylpyrophosphate transferase [Chthoniobacter flavus Ellin428]|uniref:tRNA dimethylallyltransferase n=1 Tax=Chthoniobacter flavus Ellin428 TaxID=497964 RepID=B4D0A0_9BACT|nr:tRNA (adenosine(37)-N6)-dimethylallyltransferase MiaA [Chthoniobacter flavus]EDY20414.1 tRNA delta(2)-isopentenylpyrophosphate transferase [Chthoniobacter flavus Ellin428]TCO94302.1 tRNA dimethylallyltransferase [Chthoniobacter flavus]